MSKAIATIVEKTAHFIARELKDLPPLKKGYVRVVHRKKTKNMESIITEGLRARNGLCFTSDAFPLEEDFWNLMACDFRGKHFGTGKIIMDIPQKEYNLLTRNSGGPRFYNEKEWLSTPYGVTQLVGLPKYIVGAIEQKYPWNKKCIEIFRSMASKNPEIEVPKTDLRIFNRGRSRKNDDPFGLIIKKDNSPSTITESLDDVTGSSWDDFA